MLLEVVLRLADAMLCRREHFSTLELHFASESHVALGVSNVVGSSMAC